MRRRGLAIKLARYGEPTPTTFAQQAAGVEFLQYTVEAHVGVQRVQLQIGYQKYKAPVQ